MAAAKGNAKWCLRGAADRAGKADCEQVSLEGPAVEDCVLLMWFLLSPYAGTGWMVEAREPSDSFEE